MEIQIKSREERGIADTNVYYLESLKVNLYHSTQIIHNKGGTLMKFKFIDESGVKVMLVKHLVDYGVKLEDVLKQIADIEEKFKK